MRGDALPQDGVDIKHSERITAQQHVSEVEEALKQELRREGLDPDTLAMASTLSSSI
jgi:hypothetical protein